MIESQKFYEEKRVGINYAQARYLMLYLQEKKLLKEYYRAFRDHVKDDPSGLATLKKLLKVEDLTAFEGEWRKWVLTLKFD